MTYFHVWFFLIWTIPKKYHILHKFIIIFFNIIIFLFEIQMNIFKMF